MRLPVPVVRADAVEHYAELLSSEALPSEALCLTAVRGLTIDEVLARFDASPQTRTTTLADAGQASVNAFPDELFLVVADERDGWVFLAEHNGYHGSLPEVLTRVSHGTVAATAYWNVNLDNTIVLARGQILGEMDFVEGTEPTADLAIYLDGLNFDDTDIMCASAITFVERVTGVRLDVGWATAPHQTAVITQPSRFESHNPASWLVVNAPEVFDLFRSAETSALREIAAMAASRACTAAAVDDPDIARDLSTDVDGLSAAALLQRREQLTDRLREAHFRALNLRWDRCTPPDQQADRVTRLQADVARRHADTTAEQVLVTRAHALAAVRACLSKDAITSAAQALINACQADRAHWPDLREQAATRLSEAR